MYQGNENPAAHAEPGHAAGPPESRNANAQLPTQNNAWGEVTQPQIDLMQGVIDWTMLAYTKPMYEAAITTAITLIGGIAARGFNVDGVGLNNYTILIAPTGTGKGAIAKCVNKLLTEAAKSAQPLLDLKGMGSVQSGQAILKELASGPHPHRILTLDEIGHLLAQTANPRNAVAKGIEQALLQIWPLAGEGNVFDPMGYADRDKNTKQMASPALTLAGTTVPKKWNEFMSEDASDSGLLARLLALECFDDIPPDNDDAKLHFGAPPTWLVKGIADMAAVALTHSHNRNVHHIRFEPDALALHKSFSEAVRQIMLAHGDGPARHLWNRAAEKALKLAGIWAVGRGWLDPLITKDISQNATDFVYRHTKVQADKFANGETGPVAGNESRQISEVKRVIREYLDAPYDRYADYGNHTWEMHRDGVVSEAYIQRRLVTLAAFKEDRRVGATKAIKNVLAELLSQDELREMPRVRTH